MQKSISISLFFVAFLLSFSASAQGRYTIKGGDPNGINKWYMGRQIAHVMSHFGIDWLERQEREMEENTSQLLKNLDVKPGMIIADIGAGSGYHSALLSKKVGNGKVYAVDVEPEMIAYLNKRIKQEKLSGIVPVLSKETSVSLPENTVDLVLLVDGYHAVLPGKIFYVFFEDESCRLEFFNGLCLTHFMDVFDRHFGILRPKFHEY